MKGKLFVGIYSVILIALFGACCYLMTIVNPPRLPESESRRFHGANDMYPRDSLLPHDNPDYGLEKIPEGVDADEFRKHLLTKVTKYDLETEQYEPGKRVVPPIWPSDNVSEKIVYKQKNNESNPKQFGTPSPVKGHRRSVNANKLHNVKESPGSILLKIVDDSGHKKIEIKFISGENTKTKKLRKNRSPNHLKSNVTTKEILKINESTNNINYDYVSDNVIQIKADDVILLNIVDDSDILLDKTVFLGANDTDDMQALVNITDLKYLNKTWNNETKVVDLEEAQKKLKEELLHKDMSTVNLMFASENGTIDSKNLNNSDFLISSNLLDSLNDTRLFKKLETMPFKDYPEKSVREDVQKIF